MSRMVVWKHELRSEINDVLMARGAQVLHVAEQGDRMQLWEQHDLDEGASEIRRFRLVGTGHEFPPGGDYVGSLLVHGGTYVFHVFEEPHS